MPTDYTTEGQQILRSEHTKSPHEKTRPFQSRAETYQSHFHLGNEEHLPPTSNQLEFADPKTSADVLARQQQESKVAREKIAKSNVALGSLADEANCGQKQSTQQQA